MKIQHAIFDMDGTITDSNGIWVNAIFHYINKCCPVSRESLPNEFFSDIIPGGTYAAIRYLKDVCGDTTAPEKIVEIIMEQVDKAYCEKQELKKGVLEFIKELKKRGADVCVISATQKYLVERALRLCGVLDYIDFIISGDERKSGKEKSYIFLEAAARMNCDVSECTLFEDAAYSVETGKKLGMTLVGIHDCHCISGPGDKMRELCDIYTDDYSSITLD